MKAIKRAGNFFRFFDMHAIDPKFTIKNLEGDEGKSKLAGEQFKSKIGGVVSLLIYILIISYGVNKAKKMFNGQLDNIALME